MTRDWNLTRRVALAACALMLGCAGALAQDAKPLKLVAFAGASNWPVWIGQQKGFFAKEKLEATLEITPNSRQMASDVFGGKFDVALTSIDNVVAYVEGQGEAQLAGQADFVAFMGVDDGMLSLMAVPGTASVNDLKGKELSVDALTTGFAFVLRDALVKSGVKLDEVKLVAVGGGAQRLTALREQKQTATLLNSPLDLIAENAGSARLARGKSRDGQGLRARLPRLGRLAHRPGQQGGGDRDPARARPGHLARAGAEDLRPPHRPGARHQARRRDRHRGAANGAAAAFDLRDGGPNPGRPGALRRCDLARRGPRPALTPKPAPQACRRQPWTSNSTASRRGSRSDRG